MFILLWVQKWEKEKASIAIPFSILCCPLKLLELLKWTSLSFGLCLTLISGTPQLLFPLMRRSSSSPGWSSLFRSQAPSQLSHKIYPDFPQLGCYPLPNVLGILCTFPNQPLSVLLDFNIYSRYLMYLWSMISSTE